MSESVYQAIIESALRNRFVDLECFSEGLSLEEALERLETSPGEYLDDLFYWGISPQGFDHWYHFSGCHLREWEKPLPPEDLFFLRGIVRGAYDQGSAAREQPMPLVYGEVLELEDPEELLDF